ncbi:diguanylate cyclase domain-containing protein [Burkholderiaceae bacterium UC74_6]
MNWAGRQADDAASAAAAAGVLPIDGLHDEVSGGHGSGSVAARALRRTARFLEWSGRLAAVAILEWEPGNGKLVLSDTVHALLGVPAERKPTLETVTQAFDVDGRAMLGAALHRAVHTREGWDAELQLRDGRTLRVMGGCEGEPPHLRVLVALQDISDRVRARADLEDALARLELATRSGRIGVWQLDLKSRELLWDATMWRLYGETPANGSLPEASLAEWIHPDDLGAVQLAMQNAIDGVQPLDISFRVRTREGELRHLRSAARVMRDARGAALRLTGVNWDETPLRREADKLHYRATHDSLTGLVNRAEFSQRLQHALQRSGEHALLALDLDHFKAVNDQHGHAAGDAVLRQIAHLIRHTVRSRDTVARLGGDEFAVLLENCSLQEAQVVADKLCSAMWRERFSHAGKDLHVGVSAGLVPIHPGNAEDELMAAADAACMCAKAAGRNQVRTGSL